jgi:hypothetical protein
VGPWRLSRPVRPVVTRFAEIVCPPDGRHRVPAVLAEFELLIAALPGSARPGLAAAFLAFDQGARLYPPARGRRFTRLADPAAGAYLTALAARPGGAGNMARKLRSLVAMCYYELADVKEEVGYHPDPYIAAVTRRRLETYRAEIEAGEALVLAPDPEVTGPGPQAP